MRRIALSLVTLVAVLAVAAVSTAAVWSDTVTVTTNVIQTGVLDIEVSTNNGVSWDPATADNPTILTGLVPGGAPTGVGTYAFSLRYNLPTMPNLNVTAQIVNSSVLPAGVVDESQLMIEVYNATSALTEATFSLAAWKAAPQAFALQLPDGNTQVNYELRASLNGTALDEWQGQTVTFDLEITGTQP